MMSYDAVCNSHCAEEYSTVASHESGVWCLMVLIILIPLASHLHFVLMSSFIGSDRFLQIENEHLA
jgi:hypothetical protein